MVGDGELSLEKLRGDVSLLYGRLERPRGEVSLSDLRDSLERAGDRENSSVGEKEGMKALGSLGVEVRDRQEPYVGEGRVLRRDGRVGDLGGNGGIEVRGRWRSDLDTGRWRFISDLEIGLGTSRYIMEDRELGLEQS